MKILYITNHNKIAKASGGFISDYMNDLLFIGLRELYGDGVVDSTKIIHLYKENRGKINKRHLWGGMTTFWLIGDNNINREDIPEKIASNYYDLIIYGAFNRCQDYWGLVNTHYSKDKIVLVDGADEDTLLPQYQSHPYFKRELTHDHPNLHPITFAIPTCKIHANNVGKTQPYATVKPGQPETYIFKTEKEYYEDYQKSYYGVTMKKAGWDCMRHYEILGNKCIPYFIGLEDCPQDTLTNFPKQLLLEAKTLASNFDVEEYFRILEQLFDYTKEHLTTKALAKYVIKTVSN